jgi:predicted TIM-barrel fold metal-dependent hydrolase
VDILKNVAIIDADTHVEETEETWDYLRPEEEALRPTVGFPKTQDPNRPPARYWNVGNHRRPRPLRDDMETKVEARELLDVELRIRHMDELGIQTHVIYPSLFLTEPAETAEQELAWTRSYNRWLADRCERSRGRLRWVVVLPYRTMDAALDELRWAHDHGAVGVLKKGDEEAERWPVDPYYFPVYEEAQRLNMPLCIHIGSGMPIFPSSQLFEYQRFMRTRCAGLNAAYSLIAMDVPRKFPQLRTGIIECGATWVPFVKYQLRRFAKRRGQSALLSHVLKYEDSDDIITANRIYVTAQCDEDLGYIVETMGDDNLLVGSDYSHNDPSKELGFVEILRQRADAGEISHETVRKMLYDNPKAFYGL